MSPRRKAPPSIREVTCHYMVKATVQGRREKHRSTRLNPYYLSQRTGSGADRNGCLQGSSKWKSKTKQPFFFKSTMNMARKRKKKEKWEHIHEHANEQVAVKYMLAERHHGRDGTSTRRKKKNIKAVFFFFRRERRIKKQEKKSRREREVGVAILRDNWKKKK